MRWAAASPTGTTSWYRKLAGMPQSHVEKRGFNFYFRIAVPDSLTKLLGKREIKISLRTSDVSFAKMRGRVLSNGLELLFRELRSMGTCSNEEIILQAREYFKAELGKSLELALLLPTDPLIDLDFEIKGSQQLAADLRDQAKKQHFSPSVLSDARALLNLINPIAQNRPPHAFVVACNAVLRAQIESARILAAQLAGDFENTSPKAAWFAGIITADLPPMPGEIKASAPTTPSFGVVAARFLEFKSKDDWAPKTIADVKRVIALATELTPTH